MIIFTVYFGMKNNFLKKWKNNDLLEWLLLTESSNQDWNLNNEKEDWLSNRIFLKTHIGKKKYYKDCEATEICELCGGKRKQERIESLGNADTRRPWPCPHSLVVPEPREVSHEKPRRHGLWASGHGRSFCVSCYLELHSLLHSPDPPPRCSQPALTPPKLAQVRDF